MPETVSRYPQRGSSAYRSTERGVAAEPLVAGDGGDAAVVIVPEDEVLEVVVAVELAVLFDRARGEPAPEVDPHARARGAAEHEPRRSSGGISRRRGGRRRSHAVPEQHDGRAGDLAANDLVELVLVVDQPLPAVLLGEIAEVPVVPRRAAVAEVVDAARRVPLLREPAHELVVAAHVLDHAVGNLHGGAHRARRDINPSKDGVGAVGAPEFDLPDSDVHLVRSSRGRRPAVRFIARRSQWPPRIRGRPPRAAPPSR